MVTQVCITDSGRQIIITETSGIRDCGSIFKTYTLMPNDIHSNVVETNLL